MLNTLKKRHEFLRVAKEGFKMVSSSIILTATHSLYEKDAKTSSPNFRGGKNCSKSLDFDNNSGEVNQTNHPSLFPHIGFTTTKKLGKAVTRNKARRRMRALARTHLAQFLPNIDYVLIGRHNTADIEFIKLESDFLWALKKINKLLSEKKDA